MKISEAKDNFIFTTKIELTDDGKEYVVLREPTTQEISGLGDDGLKNLEIMTKCFPNCVVESSFTDDDGNPADGRSIYNALKDSGSLFTQLITDWIQSVPFGSRLKAKQK